MQSRRVSLPVLGCLLPKCTPCLRCNLLPTLAHAHIMLRGHCSLRCSTLLQLTHFGYTATPGNPGPLKLGTKAYGCIHPLRDVIAVPHQAKDDTFVDAIAGMSVDDLLRNKSRCGQQGCLRGSNTRYTGCMLCDHRYGPCGRRPAHTLPHLLVQPVCLCRRRAAPRPRVQRPDTAAPAQPDARVERRPRL